MTEPAAPACLLCGAAAPAERLRLRERVTGSGETFAYFECAGCGTVQRADDPGGLARFYAGAYYSFDDSRQRRPGLAGRWLRRARARHALGRWSPLGRLVSARAGVPPVVRWMAEADAAFDDRILDVGCGAGDFVHALRNHGFSRANGIDPHLPGDRRLNNGACLRRAGLDDATGPYDVLLISHALEHMPDPLAALARAHALLRDGGRLVLRVPLADSHARRHYGGDWVQLDPPRHAFIPTAWSLRAAAERCGFVCTQACRDSTAFQFWGSELTRRGVALANAGDPPLDYFDAAALAAWRREADRLNREDRGDQGVFHLRKETP